MSHMGPGIGMAELALLFCSLGSLLMFVGLVMAALGRGAGHRAGLDPHLSNQLAQAEE